uniref:Uncharacterized protein n=1 Tax=Arundo donax TaxID=35708 RepID=A0A0A8ZDL7_ARUDO
MLIIYLSQRSYLKGHRAMVDILLFYIIRSFVTFLLLQCFRSLICSIHWHL